MTDLERATEINRRLRAWQFDHTTDRWITLLMIHLIAVRREAAEEMRKLAKAAAVAYRDEADAGVHSGDVGNPNHLLGQRYAANNIAKRIARLPLPPKELK